MGKLQEDLVARKHQVIARGVSNSTNIFVKEAKGAAIIDVEGNEYIDFYAGIGTLNTGHCPPPVVEAIKNQADKLLHTCFMVTMYDSYVELAEKLVEITPGDFDKRVMFVNSGAECVENAVKIARSYTKRPGIISFECAFHGRTLMTMSLTSKVKPYKYGFGPFAPEVYKIPSAYCYRCYYRSKYPECGMHCLEQFERMFAAEVAPDNVAAMIIEPVQGEGGFIVPPKEFLPGLRKIADKYGIVLIADEVQTGFGRTGKMFASEHFGLEPDLMTVAKSIAAGMPLSGVVGKADIMNAPNPGEVGGTYSGNPLSCVAGLANIEYIKNENLVERANAIGEKTRQRMLEMKEKYPIVGDVRGLGAMNAMEFVKDRETKEPAKDEAAAVIKYCIDNGVVVCGAGIFGNVVRTLIPLVVTDEQLEKGLNVLEQAVASVSK